nr:MAG TPA: hypothetical protein [Crassvirales sp.]
MMANQAETLPLVEVSEILFVKCLQVLFCFLSILKIKLECCETRAV